DPRPPAVPRVGARVLHVGRAPRGAARALRHDRPGRGRVPAPDRPGRGDPDAPRGDRAAADLRRRGAAHALLGGAGQHGTPDVRAAREPARRDPLLLRALPGEVAAPGPRARGHADPPVAAPGHPPRADTAGDTQGGAMRLERRSAVLLALLVFALGAVVLASRPRPGDVRAAATDDQAAQVYVIFPRWPAPLVNSEVIGYVWDGRAPVGTRLTSPKASNVRIIVVESGPAKRDVWQREVRNVAEDY